MIVAILNVYLVILFILVKMKIVPFNLFWKVSPLIVLLLLMFGLFIPMGWGAPQGPATPTPIRIGFGGRLRGYFFAGVLVIAPISITA